MATLNTHVNVDGTWYGPGEVPEDVAARITNPKVWDGERSTPPDPAVDQTEGGGAPAVQEPPRGGAGSSVDVWRAFLTEQKVENLPDDASRDELVELWDARKTQG